jgi:hypothetical protein
MNRRRHANIVPVAALVRWVVAAFFLCTAGLSYVYCKYQMHSTGDHIRNLEAQLSGLIMQDDTRRSQIDRLTSHSYLARRLSEGFIRLTPIRDDRIVRVHLPGARNTTASLDANDLQSVSNRLIGQ